jgi:hypothetical protein
MKTTDCILLMALALPLAAQTAAAPKSAPAKPAAARPADPAPLSPPANAERVDINTFRWKDASGDFWIYKKSPFGWSRIKEKDVAAYSRTPSTETAINVIEVRGDEVVLEKPTPFGSTRWTKKKSDLNADERAAMDRWSNRTSPPAKTAAAGKE